MIAKYPSERSVSAQGQAAHSQQLVSDLISRNIPRKEILARLTIIAEEMTSDSSVGSILVLDEQGLLRNGASPRLPKDYLAAIDGLKPDANVGTCASAAATGNIVITPDFLADEKWLELRHLPLALGFIAAWSVPIKSPDGKVLGTFGIYFRDRCRPTLDQLISMQYLADAASLSLMAS